jgi:hypothetical protein
MRRALLLLPLALLAGALSCKNGDARESSGESAPAPGNPESGNREAQIKRTGVLEGVVRLAPGHEVPSYAPEQMEAKVLDHAKDAPEPETCTPPRTTDRQPVLATGDGALSNILLAPSQFSQHVQRAPQVHEVSIEDCRLKPSFVAAMKGDLLRVRNTLNYPFMPAYAQDGMARTLLPGQTYDAPLDKPGVNSLRCGFTAPCGRTDVVVMLHPLYAVTNGEGKFRFDDFPADENVVLSAWHPLFEETKVQVRVQAGEHKTIEVVLTPRVARAPAPTSSSAPPAKTAP